MIGRTHDASALSASDEIRHATAKRCVRAVGKTVTVPLSEGKAQVCMVWDRGAVLRFRLGASATWVTKRPADVSSTGLLVQCHSKADCSFRHVSEDAQSASSPKTLCSVRRAVSASFSPMMALMTISLVEMCWMLIFASDNAVNILAATPV